VWQGKAAVVLYAAMRWHTRLALAWRIVRGDFVGYIWNRHNEPWRIDDTGRVSRVSQQEPTSAADDVSWNMR